MWRNKSIFAVVLWHRARQNDIQDLKAVSKRITRLPPNGC